MRVLGTRGKSVNRPKISTHSSTATLAPSPINPDWIIEDEPEARNCILNRSSDGVGCVILWECTAGKFEWHYDIDEMAYIIEGSVIVGDERTPPRRLGPGDVIFFPRDSVAKWHVESYVRKIAYCHKPLPNFARFPIAILRKLKAMLHGPSVPGLMDSQA